MRGMLATIGAVAAAAGVFVWGACGGGEETPEIQGPPAASGTVGSTPAAPESQLIELDDFYIEPKEITGTAGETPAVTAFGEGQQTHTLTIDALGVDREFPPSDAQEFSLPLKEAGEFKVYCRFHRDKGMTATLKVSE